MTVFKLLDTAQHIEPAFVRSVRPSVAGSPKADLAKTARLVQQGAERCFREIRKDSAVPVPFRFSVFERCIENAARFQRMAYQTHHAGEVGFSHMQKRSASPDAVERILKVQFLKTQAADRAADAVLRKIAQFPASIHSTR